MNPLKKIYCRLFRPGFRVALPFLPYREPKILPQLSTPKRNPLYPVPVLMDRDQPELFYFICKQ